VRLSSSALLFGSMLLLLLMSSSCTSAHSERAAKMSGNAPKNMHSSDLPFFAVCRDGAHDVVWHGQERTTKEWAIRDAAQHEKEFPGHHVTIEHKVPDQSTR
jgi:hypothetical protein